MELSDKLAILGEAARYDASCSSSGSGRQGRRGGIGNAHMAGICHSWAEDGRCISLLKILMSNACIYNCAYCANRCTANTPRATFTPEEIADITVAFYKRNYIEGLFLSSGVIKGPDYTMELMYKSLLILRTERGFCGYIHVKVIPGTSPELVNRIGMLADRVSVNVELPAAERLALLAPQKNRENIIAPMEEIRSLKLQNAEERKQFKKAPIFAPAGQSTQMIVGATPDSDAKILRLSSALYKRYSMKRVYFSAYVPVGSHPTLPPPETKAPLLREHRLYQADWLMRFYGFDAEELVEANDNLESDLDPKCSWALRHMDMFPVEINTADYSELLRVPGIGVVSAKRIVAARRSRSLEHSDLKKLGIVMKRASAFITCKGRFESRLSFGSGLLRTFLSEAGPYDGQMSLPEFAPVAMITEG